MVQAPDIGCLSMAPWTADDIGLLQLFTLQLARKTKTISKRSQFQNDESKGNQNKSDEKRMNQRKKKRAKTRTI